MSRHENLFLILLERAFMTDAGYACMVIAY